MLRSLKNYTLNTLYCIAHPAYLPLLFKNQVPKATFDSETPELEKLKSAIEKALKSFLLNQNRSDEGGLGSYYFRSGYTSSYPETTGYIIPSLLACIPLFNEMELHKSAQKASDWLLSIQKPSGGWQGGYVHQNQPEVVFNTGQIIKGMLASYAYFKDEKYLNAAIKAADWLCSIQENEGFWKKNVYLNQVRVYDTYVANALADCYTWTQYSNYKAAALSNCLWVVRHKQLENGWFADADNTIAHNDRPILHTIAYTLDGLIDVYKVFPDEKEIFMGAQKCADALVDVWNKKGVFKGRYDKNWQGSEETINTGCAQTSIAMGKMYDITQDNKYLKTKISIDQFLLQVQVESPNLPHIHGTLTGSTPIWGRYEAFCSPNWATKYLIDALLYYFNKKL